MLGDDVKDKLRRLVQLREARDEAAALAKSTDKEYREYEEELFDELAESPFEGGLKVNLGEKYGTVGFGPRETFFARIIDKEAALEYFEQAAREDEFVEDKFAMGRLHEHVRDCLDEQRPLPPGVDFYARRGISITRPKG